MGNTTYPPIENPPPPPPGDGADKTDKTNERMPFFEWYTHRPIAWVGTGVTGVGLILGIVGTAGASSARSKANDDAAAIQKYASTDPVANFGAIKNVCGPSQDKAGGELPGYAQACGVLRDDLSTLSTNNVVLGIGWTMFGVGAIGTGVYAVLDWYLPKKSTATTSGPRVLAVTPSLAPGYQGLGVVGTF